MTPRVVVLSDEKDLALCHPEERSEEGSRVWFNQNQRLDPSGGETALRMTIPVVVLSSAKDLDLIVILNGVKNLVLLFSKSKSDSSS
jgi:hypothetical protein